MTAESHDSVGHLLRDLAPQVLGAVARRHEDFATAEDAVQEALIAAATQWPEKGVPRNPRGWLYHVAMRRVTDHVRSEMARRRREDAVAGELLADAQTSEPSIRGPWPGETLAPWPGDALAASTFADFDSRADDSLALLFMCCHPSLTSPTAIALTLRAVGGLTTAEIANAFFVPEATMAQRISRAKQSIRTSGVPFSMPDADERAERLASVLHVLYLIFNEGYASSAGAALQRTDLSGEAIRLARLVHNLLPDDAEVTGLLALMLLTDARRAARTGAAGELIPLDEQDRTLWNHEMIAEGVALVSEALSRGRIGPYQLQAAIAAVHDEAANVEDTDWPQILALYGVLENISASPMVSLNRAIAVAMVHGPEAGLEVLVALADDPRLRDHHRLHAVRAHLHERAGDHERAVAGYRAAAEKTASIPERDYLLMRAARLSGASHLSEVERTT